MQTLTETKTAKFIAVQMNGIRYWTDEAAKHCDAIYTVYYYDSNTATYCCEFTPSYFLQAAYSYPVFKPEFQDNEEIRDKVYNIIDEGDAQGDDYGYYHCHYIDGISQENKRELGSFEYSDDKEYRELEQSIEENLRANHIF